MLSFGALGPLGNMLTPSFFPDAFRTYYFILPLFPFFFLSAKERIVKTGILFLPFLIYCLASAFTVEYFGSSDEPHPLFRFLLLFCQFFFIIGAASCIKEKEELIAFLKTYLIFFFSSLCVGYFFFIGYYLEWVSLTLISRFSVLTQFGFNLLRFSPGSYPNEYGMICSFVLSTLMVIYFSNKTSLFNFSKKWLCFFWAATFLAFLLTTTRAAYLSFFISLIYLSWKSGWFTKGCLLFSIFIAAIFGVLRLFEIDMLWIISTGFSEAIDKGSLGERYFTWLNTIELGKKNLLFGTGFASLTNTHNVYLQLFFEIGLVGFFFLIASLFLSFIESFLKYKKPRPEPDETSDLLKKIRVIGLIDVLSFAASNHNLNHHLTWLVFFLCLASLSFPKQIRSLPGRPMPQ